MKYIITESQSKFIKLTRRLNDIDRGVKNYLETLDTICRYPFDDLLDSVKYNVMEYMKYTHFWELRYDSKEWLKLSDTIFDYIDKNHHEYILEYYNKKCKK